MKIKVIILMGLLASSVFADSFLTIVKNKVTDECWGRVYFMNPSNTYAGLASTGSIANISNSWFSSAAYTITTTDINNWNLGSVSNNHVPTNRVLTINNVSYPLDADRNWSTMGSGYSTKTMALTLLTATNDSLTVSNSFVMIQRGLLYPTLTNLFSKTVKLTFYANNDYKGSNAYRRFEMPLASVPLTNGVAAGTNIVQVSDTSGFATNCLVFFTESNELGRVASISTGTLTLEDNLLYGHSINGNAARVGEFGAFPIIDRTETSNVWYQISATNAIGTTFKLDLEYRR